MADLPPPTTLPVATALADQSAGYTLWSGVPGIYQAIPLGRAVRGDGYYIDANTAVLASVLGTTLTIHATTKEATSPSPRIELQLALKVAAEETTKLGWQATWSDDGDVLVARIPNAQADKVASTTFEFYRRFAKRLGVSALRDATIEFDVEDA